MRCGTAGTGHNLRACAAPTSAGQRIITDLRAARNFFAPNGLCSADFVLDVILRVQELHDLWVNFSTSNFPTGSTRFTGSLVHRVNPHQPGSTQQPNQPNQPIQPVQLTQPTQPTYPTQPTC
jgi:hypothetical protein